MGRVYVEKMGETQKLNAIFAFPIHSMPLNCLKVLSCYLIDNDYTLAAILLVSTSKLSNRQNEVDMVLEISLVSSWIVPPKDLPSATYSLKSKNVKLRILYETMG